MFSVGPGRWVADGAGVPRQHYTTLSDLPSSLIGPLFSLVQLLTRAVEQAVGARDTFIGVNNRVSQSVPHLHVHVVPRNPGDGLKGFFWPRRPCASPRHAADAQQAIRLAVAALRF